MNSLMPLIALLFMLPQGSGDINPTRDPSSPSGVYIPRDLDDAIAELKKMLPASSLVEIKRISEGDMSLHHEGLGRWLRNNWGLWKGGRLAKTFNSMGVYHPDDMSSIVLKSFWRHLNERPIDLSTKVRQTREYWGTWNVGDDFACPWDDSKVFVRATLPGMLRDGVKAEIGVGRCMANDHLWAAQYEKRPWRPAGAQLEAIRKLEAAANKPWKRAGRSKGSALAEPVTISR